MKHYYYFHKILKKCVDAGNMTEAEAQAFATCVQIATEDSDSYKGFQRDLWHHFRQLRARLDKAGNKTKAWHKVRGER